MPIVDKIIDANEHLEGSIICGVNQQGEIEVVDGSINLTGIDTLNNRFSDRIVTEEN
jgi:hypothetical protein